ncbi:MAG TPA: helix-turn-helix transcriptional regulator [Bradyrhizobium sp.]|jgi:predicted XRE-type DNA-binding protein|nr:helix-turn-helix transcriptional regulator [Bradyrhizobium sp.]
MKKSKKEKLELVRGSGNVFRDFGHPDADLLQAKAILAAKIIAAVDGRGWTAREAEKATGVAHTDLSRIRNVKLDRFTLDRMITILGKLDQDIEVTIDVKPRDHGHLVHA